MFAPKGLQLARVSSTGLVSPRHGAKFRADLAGPSSGTKRAPFITFPFAGPYLARGKDRLANLAASTCNPALAPSSVPHGMPFPLRPQSREKPFALVA